MSRGGSFAAVAYHDDQWGAAGGPADLSVWISARGSNEVAMTARLKSLDMMRGTAVLLMVFGHSTVWGRYGDIFPAYAAFSGAMTGLRMPVLMLIAGMMATSLKEHSVRKVADRCAALFWLYIIWMPINWMATAELSPGQMLVSAPTALSLEIFRPNTVMWFIWLLTILTASVPIVSRIGKLPVVFAALGASLITYKYEIPVWSYNNLFRYSIFFYVGLNFRAQIFKLLVERFSLKIAFLLGVSVIIMHFTSLTIKSKIGWEVLGSAERLLLCIAALYLIRILEALPSVADSLQWVGSNTLPIYVAHIPVIFVFREIMPNLGLLTSSITPLIITLVGVGTGLIIHHFLYKDIAPWLYRCPKWFSVGSVSRFRPLMTRP